MSYFDAITAAMTWLGDQDKTHFLGQAVGEPGTFMYNTLKHVSPLKRQEMPVCESFQLQYSIGLALSGNVVPISIFPRLNFLLLATADMVNTLDKIPAISCGQIKPKVIIRSCTGPDRPIHPGHQHVGDYTEAFRQMFTTIHVARIDTPDDAMKVYQEAFYRDGSTLVVENGACYSG